jgi:hypothetical protein
MMGLGRDNAWWRLRLQEKGLVLWVVLFSENGVMDFNSLIEWDNLVKRKRKTTMNTS